MALDTQDVLKGEDGYQEELHSPLMRLALSDMRDDHATLFAPTTPPQSCGEYNSNIDDKRENGENAAADLATVLRAELNVSANDGEGLSRRAECRGAHDEREGTALDGVGIAERQSTTPVVDVEVSQCWSGWVQPGWTCGMEVMPKLMMHLRCNPHSILEVTCHFTGAFSARHLRTL